jgi:hypothetical protein
MTDPAKPAAARDDAATAGRGFLVITAAKLWFMVGGAAINFGLPYIFGSQALYGEGADGRALYGQYIDLNNTLSILSMVMVTGVMQSVSRFVSASPEAPGGIVRQARNLMLIVGGLVAGGFILLAPLLSEARNNPELVNGYRAAGLILFAYGIYTVFIGTLNGRKLFLRQALFDIGFTSLKAVLVLGFAIAGLGVVGAFSGFAAAALAIMTLAIWRVGRRLEDGPSAEGLYRFAAWVMGYTLVFNFIFKLDVVMLKPLAVDMYQSAAWLADATGTLGWIRAPRHRSQRRRPHRHLRHRPQHRPPALAGHHRDHLRRLPDGQRSHLRRRPRAHPALHPPDPALLDDPRRRRRRRARRRARSHLRHPAPRLRRWRRRPRVACPRLLCVQPLQRRQHPAHVVGPRRPSHDRRPRHHRPRRRALPAHPCPTRSACTTCSAAPASAPSSPSPPASSPASPCSGATTAPPPRSPPPCASLASAPCSSSLATSCPRSGRIASLAVAIAVGLTFIAALVITREFGPEDKARLLRIVRRRR